MDMSIIMNGKLPPLKTNPEITNHKATSKMHPLTMSDRALLYNQKFAHITGASLRICSGRITGEWFLGQSYGNKSEYYGAFPGNWLKRVMCMFPDKTNILHLFSGSLPPGNYTRFDRRPELADVTGEAEKLSTYFPENTFDLIIADPPYTGEDAKKYGTILCDRTKVLSEARHILIQGGHIAWLDQVWPMYNKQNFIMAGAISVFISTNHRIRGTFIYEKV